MSDERWRRIQVFQSCPTTKRTIYGEPDWNATARDVKEILAVSDDPCSSTLWEFDATTPDLRDHVRFVAAFNAREDERVVEWTWLDVHVRWPVAKALCFIVNTAFGKGPRG